MFNVDPFLRLAARLESEFMSEELLAMAYCDNEWFDRDNIESSLRALRDEMLCKERLMEFVGGYTFNEECRDRCVALVLAGNIPFVGFADVLYSVLCGVKTYVKYSSKDNHTMRWLVGLLKECGDSLFIEEYSGQSVDMVIATGSNNSNRYFEYNFSGKPSIMRGSRGSMAIISGNESDSELLDLWNDLFLRYGQGCRNMSLLYIACEFDVTRLLDIWRYKRVENRHFMNCYSQQKALMTMQKESFYDLGYATLVEKKSLHTPVSQINFARYDSIKDVEEFITENESALQCVLRGDEFGKAQYPQLNDYADNIDVMNFLLNNNI